MTGAQLNGLFRSASAPDPPPQGLLLGRILTAVFDPYGALVGEACRFWLGKRFEADGGMNLVTATSRPLLRALAPSQPLRPGTDGALEGFPFGLRMGVGKLDLDIEVLILDYALASNPSPRIHRLRDELVAIEGGLYLGKILIRVGGNYRAVGFFSLEA
ncbi:MAG: hypothetical protein M3454_09935 [Actinomycetota bacterium]|nr:hypothetical protein [Actinomycetota bacterium]